MRRPMQLEDGLFGRHSSEVEDIAVNISRRELSDVWCLDLSECCALIML